MMQQHPQLPRHRYNSVSGPDACFGNDRLTHLFNLAPQLLVKPCTALISLVRASTSDLHLECVGQLGA
jgi:hypothetical protein